MGRHEREAIDDVSYLTMLEFEINRLSSSDSRVVIDLVKNAEEYLQSLKDSVRKYNNYGKYTANFEVDLYEIRETVIKYLLEFKSHKS